MTSDSITEQAARVSYESQAQWRSGARLWSEATPGVRERHLTSMRALADAGLLAHQAPATEDEAARRKRIHDEIEWTVRTVAAHYRGAGKFGTAVEDSWIVGYIDRLAEKVYGPATEDEAAEVQWARAFRTNDGLFVDDNEGAFCDAEDVAAFVKPQNPESPYDLIVSRTVGPWREVSR